MPSATRFGPFEIVDLLGAGGMGDVYRARDTRLRRPVAIEVLPVEVCRDPDRQRRFEHEALAIFGARATFIARRVAWALDSRAIVAAVGEGDADVVLLDGAVKP